MFGKGSSKKFERQWLLDVRSRSKPMKALRLRMAASALAIAAGVVMVLFVGWKGGEYVLDRCVYTNPRFAIERVDLYSDGIIPLEQIRTWANVQRNQNLLSLDLSRIKRDLELVPLIESASIERVLPRQLIIRVREREPIARVITFSPRPRDGLLEPSSIYLDEYGMVIPPVLRALNAAGFDSATRDLPTITGVGTNSFRPGHIVRSSQILAALRWIRAFQSSEMRRQANIRAIDVSAETALLVSTEQGGEISFAYQNFETQLARWHGVQEVASRRARFIASLDLAVTNYVPAVWQAPINSAPASVRPAQPSPYRKKHV